MDINFMRIKSINMFAMTRIIFSMFLPTIGSNRDRTTDLIRFRGSNLYVHSAHEDDSDTVELITHDANNISRNNPLERYFNLASEIKTEINRVNLQFDQLLKKHQECLRPTFTETNDLISNIEVLTSSINSTLKEIQKRINLLVYPTKDFPDRSKIISNLRTGVFDTYKQFALRFKLAQQTFNTRFNNSSKMTIPDEDQTAIDYSKIDFNGQSGARQLELEQQRNDQEIEQLARRAEEIRDIFMDLNNLIIEQGTIVDRIDYNITETLNNANAAHDEIEKAQAYQKKSRMWICVFILTILVGLLILVALMR